MNPAEFNYIRSLVQDKAAIVLEDGKEYLVQARLTPIARQEGCKTLEELVAKLRGLPTGRLHDLVVEAMTTNETSFFRDLHPFDALKKRILPELVQRVGDRPIHLWSAACSTGQEPYTLAMVIRDALPKLEPSRSRILATDLSTAVLERARQGKFSQLEVNRGLPAPMLVKNFVQEGADWRIKPELKETIEFRAMNLSAPWPAMPPMDIIFMRNVLIYFDLETRKSIFSRLRSVLRPDGYLFLGAGETTFNIDQEIETVEMGKAVCYRQKKR